MLEIKCSMKGAKPGFKTNRKTFKCGGDTHCESCSLRKIVSDGGKN